MNLAVVLGVATAVSVLAGALLVGDSVRGTSAISCCKDSAEPMWSSLPQASSANSSQTPSAPILRSSPRLTKWLR